jgi:hypothetical protein
VAEPEDCNNRADAIHPNALELANGIDDNCDGTVDEGTVAFDDEGDGYTEQGGDCDDLDANLGPGGDPCGDAVAAAADSDVDSDGVNAANETDVRRGHGPTGCTTGTGSMSAWSWLLAGLLARRRRSSEASRVQAA